MSLSSSSPTFLEYALLTVFVALLAVSVAGSVGVPVISIFERIAAALGGQ